MGRKKTVESYQRSEHIVHSVCLFRVRSCFYLPLPSGFAGSRVGWKAMNEKGTGAFARVLS
jgi:hypothetical protein